MIFHNINPVLLDLGPLQIRYYGLFWALGFVIAYFLMSYLAKRRGLSITKDDVADFLVYEIVGIIGGARLIYVLFYNSYYYFQNPFEIIALWHGGLSFHGGLAGAFLSGWWFCRKRKLDSLAIADLVVIPASLALFFGRIANFINGELVGRVTNLPWAVQFQGYEGFRHPAQLYEAGKNLLIFAILWFLKNRDYKRGTLFASFLIFYSILRFFIEFFRAPDVQLGFVAFGLTMGQFLSIAMLGFGIWVLKR